MKSEDFLTDPTFVRWVNHPDKELDTYWKDWVADNPQHLQEFKLARELLLRIQYREMEARTGAKQRILENILNSQRPAAIPSKDLRGPIDAKVNLWQKVGQLTRVAALLLITLSLSWIAYHPKKAPTTEVLAEEVSLIKRGTGTGEKLQITLPDGTRVWLNAVSEIEFPEQFSGEERLINLSGEAFFEVEKDSLRPFRVVANETLTIALGTSFNINTKAVDEVKISLLTGKVKVKATAVSEEIFLQVGQELLYQKQQGKISVEEFNPGQVISWKDGQLTFNENSLPEVVKMLEEWYGVKIHLVNSEDVEWKYSGEYKNQTLDNVLNSIAYIQKFNYSIQGKNVDFKF